MRADPCFKHIFQTVLTACVAALSLLPSSAAIDEAKPCGTVLAWLKYGKETRPIRCLDADGTSVLTLSCGDSWLDAVVAMDGGKPLVFHRRIGHGFCREGDWIFAAFVWRPDGKAFLSVDALPAPIAQAPGERFEWSVSGNRLGEIATIRYGTDAIDAAPTDRVRGFQRLPRALTHREVDEIYRRSMPVDIVLPDSVYDAGRPVRVGLSVAPGGTYRTPEPYADQPIVCAAVDLRMEILKIAKTGLEPIAGSTSAWTALKVDARRTLQSPALTLSEGRYALRCEVRRDGAEPVVRTFAFTVVKPFDVVSQPATKEPWTLGETIYERVFDAPEKMEFKSGEVAMRETSAGRYLEVGKANGSRVSTVVPFVGADLGRACVLEVEWPDDTARVMGLYMHKEVKRGAEQRDRLQCGVQAGDCYPNTGRMQTSRFYFFPSTSNMLFEVRTLVAGRPGAVRSLRIRRIDALPRLKVHRPKGFPARTFGHMDEDQTVINNFNPEHRHGTAALTEEIARYCAYTGLNGFHYTLSRYWWSLGPNDYSREYFVYPSNAGEVGYLSTALTRSGIGYFGRIFMRNAPSCKRLGVSEADYVARGWIVIDRSGDPVRPDAPSTGEFLGNILHPELCEAYLDTFLEGVRQCADRGMVGLDYDLGGPFEFGELMSLDYGYGDYDVAAFQRETGVMLPAACAVPALKGERPVVTAQTPRAAYAARFAFLTSAAVRAKWLAWRASRVTVFFARLAARVHETHPNLPIYVKLMATTDAATYYEQKGVDIAALAKIHGLYPSVHRYYTGHAWNLFRGKDEGDSLDRLYDAENSVGQAVAEACGCWPMAASSAHYFETFVNTLEPKNFRSYFQDQDVKPWGRYFLKEPAHCLGVGDMLHYQIGDQPPGMLGAEDETREFCQAFCALPAVPFKTMAGVTDPVVGRFLETEEGTYVYVVNRHHTACTVQIAGLAGAARDLSTDGTVDLAQVALKPFQLRSFLVTDTKAVSGMPTLAVTLAPDARDFYRAREKSVGAALADVRGAGMEVSAAETAFKAARLAVDEGRLCEAHRLLFLQAVQKVLAAGESLADIAEESANRAKGIVRVNCAGKRYERVDGKLFSPDRKWDGKTFGYLGARTQTTTRDVTTMAPETEGLKLYETERYFAEGYAFRVKPGRYRVRCYVRCGWAPDWRPGWWLFNLTANGAVLAKPLDIYAETKGDMQKALTPEAECTVGDDGLLTLSVEHVQGEGRNQRGVSADASVCFLNAVEIERLP